MFLHNLIFEVNWEEKDHHLQYLAQTEINYKLLCTLRKRISKLVRRNQKAGSAIADLMMSISNFKIYLEERFYPNPETGEMMSWENYGKKWHIDHIIPLASFDLTNRQQFLQACHYINLQPLWVSDHKQKTVKDMKLIKEHRNVVSKQT